MDYALIPAAGRGTRMRSVTDNYPKAMIPYKGKPIIGHQLDFLIKEQFKNVIIVVGYKKEILVEYVINNYTDKINIHFAEQKELNGLAGAVLEGIKVINIEKSITNSMFILLGDILPILEENLSVFNDGNLDFLLYKNVDDFQRWCMVDSDGKFLKLYDKPKAKPETTKSLIGVYSFSDLFLLKHSLEEVIEEDIKINGEYQLSSAIKKYNEFYKFDLIEYNEFLDFGNMESISAARHNKSRHFNSIQIIGDCVHKSSENQNKMIDEYCWYMATKGILGKYLPEIKSIDKDNSGYLMSKLNESPMQEQFVFGTLTNGQWFNFFSELNNYMKIVRSNGTGNNIKNETKEILIDKTKNRVESIKEQFNEKFYVINGKIIPNPIFDLDAKIIPLLEKIVENTNEYESVLHGDLFFGNMMFNEETSDLKVIDPRGDYGGLICFGDIRYDIAKLNHSINGYYDFIVNGLYNLEKNGAIINYNFYLGKSQKEVQKLFDLFLQGNNFDKKEIDLITGILFLSMIPLHKENEKNQVVQFAIASEILYKYTKTEEN